MPVPTSSHLSSRRRDALALLGLSSSAGPDDIKAAYRKQVLVYHPDRQQHDKEAATRTFIQIHEAYKLLIDSEDARASLKRRPSLRPEPEAEEQHARERDDSPGHADPQASSDDDQPRQAPSDDPPAQAPLSRSPSSQPPPQGQPQSQTPASESTSSQPPTSQSHTSPPPSSPHARSRTPSPNPHLFEAPRTPPSTPSESPPREESAAQPTTRAGVAPSAPPQSAPRNPQFHTPSAPPNSPAPRPPNAERTEPRVVTPPSFKEAATQSRYSSRPDSRYATNPDTYFTKPSPGAIYANTGYSPGPRYAFLDDDRPLPASAFESDGPTYKSPETRYATMPDSYFPNPITSPMPSVSGHSPGPRPHAFEEDLPLPPGVFEEDDEPFQRSSGSRYATQPDSYFPKPSPGGMPSSSGFSPGPRYAFMDDELPAAAFPDDTPTYKSPGTRYAMFPDDEYSRQAPVRQASRYASHPRYSARPSRQKDTEREARNDTLLNAFYSPRSQSTGTRYATVPDAFFPTPSPGARYNDIYSPGPRSAYLPEDPSPNPLYSPPYKSPETRYATNPDEHYTKPAAPASSEPIVEDRGRTPRRRPPRAPSPPPPTPSAPLPTDGVPQAQGKEDKRRRPKRYRERSTSAPLRCVNVDSPVEGSRHASLGPAPALSATISGSSQPGPLPDVKVTQDRQRSLSPQRRERKQHLVPKTGPSPLSSRSRSCTTA
ncbi:hypothetical protein FA95DRAFT_1012494 [Auriscalpium vulgare]|uniref:Uncharacterized protein n=1 Tax=Auriscalpium vulgare TaxID=40419 RepID=A0ACB8RWW6_9AGAM|nr:hypothetical protein FA95DRAFT_1012494 [Auriscalpium vulgare]